MSKSANLCTRIEPNLKNRAELILSTLGISASCAITMFYTQIVLREGLPFDVKLPEHPLDTGGMSKDTLNMELEKGYGDAKAGRTQPASEVFRSLRRDYNL